MSTDEGIVLGRRTYEDFFNYWPKQEPDSPFTKALEQAQKYVASTTLSEPLPWKNSTLLDGDAADGVAELKRRPGKSLVIMGSGVLIQSLMRRNLIDEYLLLIHPVVLGRGRRLFTDGGRSGIAHTRRRHTEHDGRGDRHLPSGKAGRGRRGPPKGLKRWMNILAISGSLQATSSNTRFLRSAQVGAPVGVEVTLFDDVAAIPHFNPDLDVDPAPTAVADLRVRLAASDAVLIASPEYAHGMPGALKNALDWMVGSGELYGKPVAIVCVSPRADGGVNVRQDLARTLGAQGADVVASITVQVVKSRTDDENARRVDDTVASVFDALSDRVESSGGARERYASLASSSIALVSAFSCFFSIFSAFFMARSTLASMSEIATTTRPAVPSSSCSPTSFRSLRLMPAAA